MILTFTILFSLLVIVFYAVVSLGKPFKFSQIGSIASEVEINEETPVAVLAEQLCMGNIDRDVYEWFVAEKYGVKLA